MSHIHVHQITVSKEEEFNEQVDKITRFVNVSHTLFPALIVGQWAYEQSNYDSRDSNESPKWVGG